MTLRSLIALVVLLAFVVVPPADVLAEASVLDGVRTVHVGFHELDVSVVATACVAETEVEGNVAQFTITEGCIATVIGAVLACVGAIANPIGPLTGPPVCSAVAFAVLGVCTCFNSVGFLGWVWDAAIWVLACLPWILNEDLAWMCDDFPFPDPSNLIDPECLPSGGG